MRGTVELFLIPPLPSLTLYIVYILPIRLLVFSQQIFCAVDSRGLFVYKMALLLLDCVFT